MIDIGASSISVSSPLIEGSMMTTPYDPQLTSVAATTTFTFENNTTDSMTTTQALTVSVDMSTASTVSTKINISNFLLSLSGISFELSKVKLADIVNLLESGLDLNDCLVNCTNKGFCKLGQNNSLICECKRGFTGSNCQSSSSPCFYDICLNNSTCIDRWINPNIPKDYLCECSSSIYYGQNCEHKINVCANETCSSSGYCRDYGNRPKCSCFPNYSGDHCEIESLHKRIVKIATLTSTIIAIIILTILVCILVCDDCSNLIYFHPKQRQLQKIYKKRMKPIHFVYKS